MHLNNWQLIKLHYDIKREGNRINDFGWTLIEKIILMILLFRPLYEISLYVWMAFQTPRGKTTFVLLCFVFWIGQLLLEIWSHHFSPSMKGLNMIVHTAIINCWHLYWLQTFFPWLQVDNIGIYLEGLFSRWCLLIIVGLSLFIWHYLMVSLWAHRNLGIFYFSLYIVYRFGILPFEFSGLLQEIGLHLIISAVLALILLVKYDSLAYKLKEGQKK